MLNEIVLMGRLTRDPELKKTQSGVSVCTFCLACDRDFRPKDGGDRETDFIECQAWRQTAEFISRYFSKGRMMAVKGRLEIRKWQDTDGATHQKAQVVADGAFFADSKKDDDAPRPYRPPSEKAKPSDWAAANLPPSPPDFQELPDDGALPF